MATLELNNVVKSFGKTEVIKGISLEVNDGELIVFVGPSGCGKSTVLRMIAGLETLTDGAISIGGKQIDHLPPAQRGIAMVFQSYALYPHKDVRGNLGFALAHAKVDKAEIEQRVNAAADILELGELMDRRPRELSGGQRQRVAIGRAIVREPEVFLFDEPLSNLDAALRVHMRVEILKLHQRLKNTMVYVTHDQVEAMTLADRIVVFRAGVVEQVGTPMELYRSPNNTFVAQFIGSPSMNLLTCELGEHGVAMAGLSNTLLERNDISVLANDGAENKTPEHELDAGPMRIGIRPEHLFIAENGPISGTVQVFEQLGGESYLHLELPDKQMLIAKLDGEYVFRIGDTCSLDFNKEQCHLFDADGQRVATGPKRAAQAS